MSKGTINKVMVLGRLGNDPEIRTTAGGTTVANLSVATNHVYKDQQGQKQEETEWHRAVLFAKTADLAAQYLKKGSSVYLEGRLKTNKWQDNNGQDRYTTEMIVSEMQFMGDGNQGQGQPAQQTQPQQQGGNNQGFHQPQKQQGQNNGFDDSNIPF